MRTWMEGRHAMAVYAAAILGLATACPWMDIVLVLGPSKGAGSHLMISLADMMLLVCTHVMTWAFIPCMTHVDALGGKPIALDSAMASVAMLVYAIAVPWLRFVYSPTVDDAYTSVFGSLLVGTATAMTMLMVACIGADGALVGAVVVVLLIGGESWQTRLFGFSALPGDINQMTKLRAVLLIVLAAAVCWSWWSSRAGARPLLGRTLWERR
ncbi:hypothetical protein [Bifidobacterium callitrichos]|uniref:Uncharacterized protein n=1 Tax=Bifidobacterium callitrichos DSM 23973 TaxID=1437609 RepID=A0A087AD08_9BIFI|nr:hypothetical protein [Bifidobacterium callitrichos]KFI56658.1 hypothetical protein BCAL_0263 [Bifidobacterium callitrichos DSM 23973]